MGALWKLFSGEDDAEPVTVQRTTLWGVMTGQHPDTTTVAPRNQTMTEPDIENAATAYHEAGHGRAARRGGFGVAGMWNNGDSGLTEFSGDVDPDPTAQGQRSLRKMLIAAIAGQEAEIRYLMEYHGYSRRDAEFRTHHGAGGDRAIFKQAAEGTGYTWEELQGEARSLVKWNWTTIEGNARKLSRRSHRGGTWA